MAIPQETLSDVAVPAKFLGGRSLTSSLIHDYETGGTALNDPQDGHLVQIWEAEVINNSAIVIRDQTGFEVEYYTDFNITEVSLTFDQNMRPAIALVANGQSKFIWYDTVLEQEVVTDLASDVISPRVSLDDKRPLQMGLSDIILGYLRETTLYYRMQRDRYEVEYLLAVDVLEQPEQYLVRIGMNILNRFQFEVGAYWTQEERLEAMIALAADPYTDIDPPYQVSGTATTLLNSGADSIWGPQPVIIVYALQDPATGQYWVDTEGNLLIHTVETTWNG